MEPSVQNIPVFISAGRAHGKFLHGGPVPVIRQVLDDGETGTAIRAVQEGVINAPCLLLHIYQAIHADGYIRTHPGDRFGKAFRFR